MGVSNVEQLSYNTANLSWHHPEIVKNATVIQKDYRELLRKYVSPESTHLILTDPPYAISRKTGFTNGNPKVKKLAVSMDFGKWDHSEIDLDDLAKSAYAALRKGGTFIIWYDLWKITHVKDALENAGFRMIRAIIWQKTNPVPLNSKKTYLTNSREIALVGVKGSNPTFHSAYDNGIYTTPISDDDAIHRDIVYEEPIPRHNGQRIHPTQKPLTMFSEIVRKHSNEGELICDPFLGSGTTAMAALQNNRHFIGGDIEQKYVNLAQDRIKKEFE